MEQRLEVLDAGGAIIISLSVLYYSWDGSILQPTQNTLFWEQQVGLTFHWGKWLFSQQTIFLGQEWISKWFLFSQVLIHSEFTDIIYSSNAYWLRTITYQEFCKELGVSWWWRLGCSRSLALEWSQHSLTGCITSKWAKKWLSTSVKPLPACSVSKDFPKWHKNWVESSDVRLGTTFPRFLLGRVWLDPTNERHLCELWSSVPGLWILTNSTM